MATKATTAKEVKTSEVKESVSIKAVTPKAKEVAFIPTKSGSNIIAGKRYFYEKGKEVKLPETVAGILAYAGKGRKK